MILSLRRNPRERNRSWTVGGPWHRGGASRVNEVESEPGQRHNIRTYIPVSDIDKSSVEPQVSRSHANRAGTETLLIVEDEVFLLRILSAILQSNGYAILSTGDGVKAVNVYKHHRYGICIGRH